MKFLPSKVGAAVGLTGLLSLLPLTHAAADSSIQVATKAAFPQSSYLIELLETAALENATCYFPLLDRVAEGTFSDLQTEQELYEKFLQILQDDGHISDTASLSSFKFALSLHAAAPRIQAQYQFYNASVEPSMMAAQDAACPVWVHLDGQQYCSPELERAQQPVDNDGLETELPFDHTLHVPNSQSTLTLYADITHPLFAEFHQAVVKTLPESKTSYRVRYRPAHQASHNPLYVSGYGVQLVLKRTDYIVIDDRSGAADSQASLSDEPSSTAEIKPLTSADVLDLGLKTGHYIASSETPMDTLMEVSANFPKYAAQIASRNLSKEFTHEHRQNRAYLLPEGFNIMWMNGLQIQNRDMNAYSLLNSLKDERQLIARLQSIGLSPTEAIDLLSHEVLATAQAGDEPQRYDWRPDVDSENVIIWLNDIENDTKYSKWSKSLNHLLQRTYPGQLPQVRRDIHNVIVPIDFYSIKDLDLVVNTLQMLVKRLFPIRIGLVPVQNGHESQNAAKVCYHLLKTYGLESLTEFLQLTVVSKKGLQSMPANFKLVIDQAKPLQDQHVLNYEQVPDDDSLEPLLIQSNAYVSRLALSGEAPAILANGVAVPRTESWLDTLSQRIYMDHRTIQLAVYEGRVAEDLWVPEIFLDGAMSRRNNLIIPESSKSIKVVDVAELTATFSHVFSQLPKISGEESSLLSTRTHMLLIADFDDTKGQDLLESALQFHEKHPETEITLLHNPSQNNMQDAEDSLQGLGSALYKTANDQGQILDRAKTQEMLKNQLQNHAPQITDKAGLIRLLFQEAELLVKRLGVAMGENAVWLNGRLVTLSNLTLYSEDFESLLDYEIKERIAPVTTAITALVLEEKFMRPIDIAKITSIVARSLISDIPEGIYENAPLVRIDRFKNFKNESTLIHLQSDTEPIIQIVAVVDPASETTQSWAPILKTLSELAGVEVKIFLNPRERLDELPVKRFYRNVISSSPQFHANGTLAAPRAVFSDIPADVLFNLGLVVPPAWLVAPEESIYDLDNIKLSTVPAGENVDAIYELEHILIEGHSRDVTRGSPPRGVQLLLGTEQRPHFTDTIIMANLGYFQFKANPGHWQISLKPGRSSKIFAIDSLGSQGQTVDSSDEGSSVTLMSFQGATLFPKLSRKPGMEDEDVLEGTGLADTAANYLKKGQSLLSSFGIGKTQAATSQADINIFSVASGHLYERMLNIMMVSVMKHTQHTVKFWFIEQFLSPSFKRSLPHLAEHYGFRYEMVTYKWPHWLRGQKEKQREIWGYKILFLDVLFPLDLDKVIFVDADQIVRTDMMELNKVDLHGAPYGFTPMCDSRTEMEGFRFWKQGYWANFLEGKPYHISALYVVDLKRFRELAAGDRLRGQYHSLSADPNSLSNLDQDLPNHMQHNLPIHSLDQNWLWCETWCSDEALKSARTIDLCNNPQTKEPKLDRAKRQVPEWTEYDNEIADVLQAAMKEDQVDLKAGSERQNDELSGRNKVKDEL